MTALIPLSYVHHLITHRRLVAAPPYPLSANLFVEIEEVTGDCWVVESWDLSFLPLSLSSSCPLFLSTLSVSFSWACRLPWRSLWLAKLTTIWDRVFATPTVDRAATIVLILVNFSNHTQPLLCGFPCRLQPLPWIPETTKGTIPILAP